MRVEQASQPTDADGQDAAQLTALMAVLRCQGVKRFSLCLAFVLAIQSLCYADVTKLQLVDRTALQNSARFREISSGILDES